MNNWCLLIRPGAIGDFIVSLPALESLATAHTEVWTSTPNVPLVDFTPHVQSIASTGLDMVEIDGGRRAMKRLREFDSIVSWYGSNRAEFRDAVAGLPFTFHTAIPPADCDMHAVDYYLAQVGKPPGAIPRLRLPRRDESYIVIHPFSGSATKNWPLDRYRAVAAQLERVRWCAGPEDVLCEAERFADLGSLAWWLAGARLFIGNDSGIAHLAAAAGTPVVALFGPTRPEVWAPRGRADVRIVRSVSGRMEDIRIQQVLNAVSEILR